MHSGRETSLGGDTIAPLASLATLPQLRFQSPGSNDNGFAFLGAARIRDVITALPSGARGSELLAQLRADPQLLGLVAQACADSIGTSTSTGAVTFGKVRLGVVPVSSTPVRAPSHATVLPSRRVRLAGWFARWKRQYRAKTTHIVALLHGRRVLLRRWLHGWREVVARHAERRLFVQRRLWFQRWQNRLAASKRANALRVLLASRVEARNGRVLRKAMLDWQIASHESILERQVVAFRRTRVHSRWLRLWKRRYQTSLLTAQGTKKREMSLLRGAWNQWRVAQLHQRSSAELAEARDTVAVRWDANLVLHRAWIRWTEAMQNSVRLRVVQRWQEASEEHRNARLLAAVFTRWRSRAVRVARAVKDLKRKRHLRMKRLTLMKLRENARHARGHAAVAQAHGIRAVLSWALARLLDRTLKSRDSRVATAVMTGRVEAFARRHALERTLSVLRQNVTWSNVERHARARTLARLLRRWRINVHQRLQQREVAASEDALMVRLERVADDFRAARLERFMLPRCLHAWRNWTLSCRDSRDSARILAEKEEIAQLFRHRKLQGLCFAGWRRFSAESAVWRSKELRAQHFHRTHTLQRAYDSWWQWHRACVIDKNKQSTVELIYRSRVERQLRKILRTWHSHAAAENMRREISVTKLRTKVILREAWTLWRTNTRCQRMLQVYQFRQQQTILRGWKRIAFETPINQFRRATLHHDASLLRRGIQSWRRFVADANTARNAAAHAVWENATLRHGFHAWLAYTRAAQEMAARRQFSDGMHRRRLLREALDKWIQYRYLCRRQRRELVTIEMEQRHRLLVRYFALWKLRLKELTTNYSFDSLQDDNYYR